LYERHEGGRLGELIGGIGRKRFLEVWKFQKHDQWRDKRRRRETPAEARKGSQEVKAAAGVPHQ